MAQHNAERVAGVKDLRGARWVSQQARLDALAAVMGQAALV